MNLHLSGGFMSMRVPVQDGEMVDVISYVNEEGHNAVAFSYGDAPYLPMSPLDAENLGLILVTMGQAASRLEATGA